MAVFAAHDLVGYIMAVALVGKPGIRVGNTTGPAYRADVEG